MTGCRHGAKNTLDKNYLHLAELLGAEVRAETLVVDLQHDHASAWTVTTKRPGRSRRTQSFTAQHVVFAAGALGTQRLLHRLRDEGRLPNVSTTLGELTRTNSEAIVGATARRNSSQDYSKGVAITSSFHPSSDTHIEPVRYGHGSNAMGLLATVLVDGGGTTPRPLRFLATIVRRPMAFLRSLSVRRWSERSVILLVMQSRDNSLKTVLKLRRFRSSKRLTTEQGHGVPNPTWIPAANEAARHTARHIGGDPSGAWNEAVLDIPVTAHIIGGCVISNDTHTGFIDPYHRVHGEPTLHVVDGAAISANLGVNPSLTITAQAERAISMWPNKGDPDHRPAQPNPYVPVEPIRPSSPAVPQDAPAALRW